jgi:hypothetical protein
MCIMLLQENIYLPFVVVMTVLLVLLSCQALKMDIAQIILSHHAVCLHVLGEKSRVVFILTNS